MAFGKYMSSAIWLVAGGSLGYALLVYCTPNEAGISQAALNLPGVEKNPAIRAKQNQDFINVLKAASQDQKPYYILPKEELHKEIAKHGSTGQS